MAASKQDTLEALREKIDGILTVNGSPSCDAGNSKAKVRGFEDSSEYANLLSEASTEKGDDSHRGGRKAAMSKIVALVNASDKSEKTIRERLARDGFEPGDVDEAVEQAKQYGFVDDARFAEVLVRSRIAQMRGSAGIARELAENGIDPYSIPGWPDEYPLSHEDELARALDLLKRKPPRSKNAREGAYRRLAQKGYPSSVCSSAARMWSESTPAL